MENLFVTDYELFKFYEKSKRKSNWYFIIMLLFAVNTGIFVLAFIDSFPMQEHLPVEPNTFLVIAIISGIVQGIFGGLSLIYKRTSSYLLDGAARISVRGILSTLLGLIVIPLVVAFTISKTKKL